MCGIVGHVDSTLTERSLAIVLEGLSRLEYRGYDSAGIALATPDGLVVTRSVGKLANLRAELAKTTQPRALAAIGHTRWATHGIPSVDNAHPHTSFDGQVTLVHNGIIENAGNLRRELQDAGVRCVSDTDTEVVVHLIAQEVVRRLASPAGNTDEVAASGTPLGLVTAAIPAVTAPVLPDEPELVRPDEIHTIAPMFTDSAQTVAAELVGALATVTARLEGTFTLLTMHAQAPGIIVAARRSSPLVVGLGEDENYLGSDVLAFGAHTKVAYEIGQDQIAVVGPQGILVRNRAGEPANPTRLEFDFSTDRAEKDGWPTFMEKEIHEQPEAVARTLANRLDATGALTLDELRIRAEMLRSIDKVVIIACGTASYAGMVARYAIEHWCRIPCEVELASEFRYRDPVVNEKTLVVAISQSGETMDTIMAMRHAREQGAKVVAIVNTPGSTISRESDGVLLTHAGPEIAVASTKAFLAQVAATYLFGLYLAQVRGNKYLDEIADYLAKLQEVPAKIQQVLDSGEAVRQVARSLVDRNSFIYLGRHVGYPVALEGALKLKEIAYLHAEGFAAGELKHGPIALIEDGLPVLVIVPTPRRPELHRKVISNIQEVRARGARTIVIAEEGDTAVDEFAEVIFRVPRTPTLYMPLLTAVPLQIFACELATAKGLDVDQPRNLAKSVTVE